MHLFRLCRHHRCTKRWSCRDEWHQCLQCPLCLPHWLKCERLQRSNSYESYHVNNITVNLTKDGNATQVVHSTLPTSCYNRVFGFDIEYNGSVAAVAVPGNLISSSSSDATTQCEVGTEETTMPPAAAPLPSESTPDKWESYWRVIFLSNCSHAIWRNCQLLCVGH